MAEGTLVIHHRGTHIYRLLAGVLFMVAAGLVILPAAGGAQVPAVDASAEALAGVVQAALAGDEAAAALHLLGHADPGRDGHLRSELRNLMWEMGRREDVALELVYRVGRELFVLLRSADGDGYQFAVEVPPDTFRIEGFYYPSGWWGPAEGPLVLGSMALGGGHATGIPPDLAEVREGLALYVSAAGTELAPATLEWRVVNDDYGRADLRLVTEPPGAAMLLAAFVDLAPGPALTLARHVTLAPDHPLAHFELGNRRYEVELDFTDPDACDAAVVLRAGDQSQELYRVGEACDEPHFMIEWAGDLDGDGALDLAVEFSDKYSVFPLELHLSSAARAGGLVGVAARYVLVGL